MTTLHDTDHEDGPAKSGARIATQTPSGRRPTVNITAAERIGRVAMGLVAIVAGALLLAGAGSALAVVLEVLLVLAGLDLAVTGAIGHCPLYRKLGYVPRSLRRSS
ncbi:MAG: DUF2892 domain-containing protein [Acidimicrobiales bacterium]|nr:DUF2892 domain-containing protein [Acidimicrobiales bacterium]